MVILLENDILRVQIDTLGGRLSSIQTKSNDLEYLWQKSKFPHLFPVVGRLHEKRYTINGASYPMEMHGFLRNTEMHVVAQDKCSCVLELTDTTESRASYPYTFTFRICYCLEENKLQIGFAVENHTQETLYCAMGGHPGFNVPMEKDLAFEDYELTFSKHCKPEQVVFSDNVLTTNIRLPYELEAGTRIVLRHSLFAHDALVLKDTSSSVTISSPKGKHGVRVDYPQMPYVGFWQYDKGEPQFVCVEPWSALPGREGIVEALDTMPDLTEIEAGECSQNEWSITVW